MRLEPLIAWWGVIPLVIVLGIAIWQLWRGRRKGKLLRWVRRSGIIALLLLMAIGPSIPGGTSALGAANLDVLFVVDTTPSMGALDYDGTQQRMVGVRNDLLALSSKLEGARFEVMTFDSSANLVLPFTNDLTAFRSAVEGLLPDVTAYSGGTTVDKPFMTMVNELKYSKTANPSRKQLLFYLSDGEQTISSTTKKLDMAQVNLGGGAVLGYGTKNGARVIKYVGPGEIPDPSQYVLTLNTQTKKLEPVTSKIDTARLRAIAEQMKVRYYDRNSGGAIDEVYHASKAPLLIDNSQHIVHYLNLYWLIAMPLVVLVFWEWQILAMTLISLRKKRRGKRA